MRSVALLGSTGSIGRQAIQVCDDDPDLRVCALAAGSDADAVVREAERLGAGTIALADPSAAASARTRFAGRVLQGQAGVAQLAAESGADVVLNAVVGAAGLDATLTALEAGIDVALANKESLVAAVPLCARRWRRRRALLPVDSEHSALHQLLAGEEPDAVEALIVTASGGPFRGRTMAELSEVTAEQALRHPTWPWARASRSTRRPS